MLVYLGLQLRQVRVKHYASKRTKFIMAHDLRIACFTLAQDDQFTTNTKETLVQIFNTSDGTLLQEVIAEALGTFMLVFSIYGIISSSQIMGGGQVGLLEYAITASLAVIVVVFSIGGISGAHVNPAVTIAFATAGPFPWSKELLIQLQYPKRFDLSQILSSWPNVFSRFHFIYWHKLLVLLWQHMWESWCMA